MASRAKITVTTTSPKSSNGDSGNSPKGVAGQQCLCSPTTHQGSFRCRFHRSASTTAAAAWFKRSKSMPPTTTTTNNNNIPSISSKSVVEST